VIPDSEGEAAAATDVEPSNTSRSETGSEAVASCAEVSGTDTSGKPRLPVLRNGGSKPDWPYLVMED
jgi:hypothetical protein